jgi:hypothetical protein
MKQTYWSLSHQALRADVWVGTLASSKELLADKMERLKEADKAMDLNEVSFNNFFIHNNIGPGSEYVTMIREGFTNLGEVFTSRGSSIGHMWCLTEHKDNPEVVSAVERKNADMARSFAGYYSQPWV